MTFSKKDRQAQLAHLKKRIMMLEEDLTDFIVEFDALLTMDDVELSTSYELMENGDDDLVT
jgi:hypothetical protein